MRVLFSPTTLYFRSVTATLLVNTCISNIKNIVPVVVLKDTVLSKVPDPEDPCLCFVKCTQAFVLMAFNFNFTETWGQ